MNNRHNRCARCRAYSQSTLSDYIGFGSANEGDQGIEAGHRIGAIAGLSDTQIRALLPEPPQHDTSGTVDEMLNAVRRLDGPRLELLLAREALALGPFNFCRLTVGHLLDRIGTGWAEGQLCVAEEHLAAAAIKSTLMSLLRFDSGRTGDDTMVFSTFPGEHHEIGALMAAVCAQNAGARVLYLGPDLPISEIVTAARRSAAKVVGISAAMPATKEQRKNLGKLKNELPCGVFFTRRRPFSLPLRRGFLCRHRSAQVGRC